MSKRNICTKIFSGLNEFIFDQIISILYHLFTTNKKYFKITVLSFASIFERGFFGRDRFLLEEDEDRSSPMEYHWVKVSWSMSHGLWVIESTEWTTEFEIFDVCGIRWRFFWPQYTFGKSHYYGGHDNWIMGIKFF